MAKVKLNGMREVQYELNHGFIGSGFCQVIVLDRASGKIWAYTRLVNRPDAYRHEDSWVVTTVRELRAEQNATEYWSNSTRNKAIRDWAEKQLAEYAGC